jgi:hypothetical protein
MVAPTQPAEPRPDAPEDILRTHALLLDATAQDTAAALT